LPEPLGPMMPIRSPRAIVVVRSRTMTLSPCITPAARASTLRLQTHRALALPPAGPLPPHRFQRSHPPFVAGAPGLDALPDPGFFTGKLLVELGPFPFLGGKGGVFALEVAGVVDAPVHQPAPVELHDPGGHPLKKRPVMGDEAERAFPVEQEILHPLDGITVEMIGRLVQQENVGVGHQGPGEERLPLSSSREPAEGRVLVEAKVGDDGFDAAVKVPGIGRFQRVVQLVQLPERLVSAGAHAGGSIVIAGEQRPGFTEPGGDDIEDAAGELSGNFLLQAGHRCPTLAENLPGIGSDAAVEQFHHGALAGAVSAQETDPFAPVKSKGRGFQDRGSAEGNTDIVHSQQGHSRSSGREARQLRMTEDKGAPNTGKPVAKNHIHTSPEASAP
jgi:hypothetical protein